MARIAILGGTGPEGLGLGLRFAMAGEEVVIGSRQAARAAEAAQRATDQLRAAGCTAALRGVENRAAVESAELIVVATPFVGVMELLPPLAPSVAGKVVLDVVNPLQRANKQFVIEHLPGGSAAETIQQLLPASQVVAAFKNESAEELNELAHPVEGDIVVCSDHAEARARIMALVDRIPRYRAIDGGPLINARSVEAITAMLLNINRRYRAVTSIRILGLPDRDQRAE